MRLLCYTFTTVINDYWLSVMFGLCNISLHMRKGRVVAFVVRVICNKLNVVSVIKFGVEIEDSLSVSVLVFHLPTRSRRSD